MFEVRPLSKFDFAFSRFLRSLSWPFGFNHTKRVHFDDVESGKKKQFGKSLKRLSKGFLCPCYKVSECVCVMRLDAPNPLWTAECVDNQWENVKKFKTRVVKRRFPPESLKNVKKVDWQMRTHKVFISGRRLLHIREGFLKCFLLD